MNELIDSGLNAIPAAGVLVVAVASFILYHKSVVKPQMDQHAEDRKQYTVEKRLDREAYVAVQAEQTKILVQLSAEHDRVAVDHKTALEKLDKLTDYYMHNNFFARREGEGG